MPQDPSTALYPHVVFQLAQLGLAGLAVGGVGLAMWLVRRRLGGASGAVAAGTPVRAASSPGRLTATLAMMTLCLLLALGLRQIWPHPDLRARGLAVLLITVVTATLAWWRLGRRGAGP